MIIVETEEKKVPVCKKYPYVGQLNTIVVIFTAPHTGFCIRSHNAMQIGKLDDDWVERDFKPIDKTIITTEI